MAARHSRIIGFVVSLALFMDALDTTIINTAIPAMAKSLSVHPIDLKLALISYLLSLAIFIPISGWTADKFGLKRVFISALGIFTLSSLWCGYTHSLYELVLARSIQGLGGAFMLPLGRLIILRTFPRHEVVEAMNAIIMVVSVGLMLGPLAGGFITDRLSWQWIFWVNIPVGLAVIIFATLWIKDILPHETSSFDWLGFLLFGSGLGTLTFSLSLFSESNSNQPLALTILAVSILLLTAYTLHSRKRTNAILNVSLFQIRTFQISVLGNLCARFGFGGIPFLLPLLLQVSLGFSAELSGLLVAPIALGIFTAKPFSIKVLRWLGYKKLLIINTFGVGFSLLAFQLINSSFPVKVIAVLTLLFGMLITLQYSAMNSLAYADITDEQLSAATSIVSTVQQLAQSFGVSVAALLLRYYSYGLPSSELTLEAFHHTFLAMSFITFLSSVIFIRLQAGDGHQMLVKKNVGLNGSNLARE